MDYTKAFSYVFEDKNWASKLLIAGLIGLIPIVGQFYLLGWMVEVVRRVKAGRTTNILPATHFTYFLTLGLKLFVVYLIYSLPLDIILSFMGLMNQSVDVNGSSIHAVFTLSFGCLGYIVTILLSIVFAMLGIYGVIKLAETDQIKPCLNFKDAFYCIRANFKSFFIVCLLEIVTAIIAPLGLIACLIGIIFTYPYAIAVNGHLIGQLWDNLETDPENYRNVKNYASGSDDIIEEAPFTKVQDIEEDFKAGAANTVQDADIVIEKVYDDEPQEAETDSSEPVEKPAEESNGNDDIPSFE